jgi:glycosyltransferase involved in cell wall biosynthesis
VRILMVSQFYPPTQGGEEQSVRNLSVALAGRGHQVSVVTLRHDDLPAFEVVDGVRVYRIQGTVQRARWLFSESGRRHAPPFPDPELIVSLQRIIRRERPEIVHAHNWLGYQFLPLKMLDGARLVRTLHDMSLVCATKAFMYGDRACDGPAPMKCLGCAAGHYGPAKGLVTLGASTAMNAAERAAVDMFLPVSRAAAAGNRLIGSQHPYTVVPNFLADGLGVLEPGYEEYLGQLPREEFILFVGGLRRLKGIEILLQAYSGLRDAPPLVLIGYQCLDTPSQWPSNVTVLKDWPHGAVMQAWHRSMFGVVPSIAQETFGLVVLEAMATGTPVVASRIGGLAEVVSHEETGLLVEPGNHVALRDAMQRVIDSPELRKQFGTAGLRRVEDFRARHVVPRIEDIYKRVTRRVSERDATTHALRS